MLWRVRLQYCITIDAANKPSAHEQAVKLLKSSPEAFISAVEDARYSGTKRSFLKRLLTGK